jgi:hypothetical protein
MFSLTGRWRDQPQPENPEIVPGFTAIPTPPAVLKQLGRVVAERDLARAEVTVLREQVARVTDLLAGGLLAYSVDRRAAIAADALLDLRLALIPAPDSEEMPSVGIRPSVPVVPAPLPRRPV